MFIELSSNFELRFLMQFYAKEQKDVKLMLDIMNHVKKNDLPLQPATADIVFRYFTHVCSMVIHLRSLLYVCAIFLLDEALLF